MQDGRFASYALITALVVLAMSHSAGAQTSRQVVSKDGTRIAYDTTGAGPVVMLLHGGGQTRRGWHDAGYVKRLAQSFTVITIDLRGNGESDKPTDAAAYGIDRLTDDLLAVADAAGTRRFSIWGFSYGANIGRYLAARSDRVQSMVYIGIPFGAAAQGTFAERIRKMQPAPAWLAAMLDYPPVEPAHMRCQTLWVVGTANSGAMESVEAYRGRLAGTRVSLQLLEGLTHPQEFERVDALFEKAAAFTRASS